MGAEKGRGTRSERVCKYRKKKLPNSSTNSIIVKGRSTYLGKNKGKYQILRGSKYTIRYKWATENEGQP